MKKFSLCNMFGFLIFIIVLVVGLLIIDLFNLVVRLDELFKFSMFFIL